MTREEQLSCLKDRPCMVCKFHDDEGCHKWTCVFEDEPTVDAIPLSVIDEIKAEIGEMIEKNETFDSDNSRAQIIALEWVCEVIDEKVKEYKS